MLVAEAIAPSYERLRPLKTRTSDTFPVYPSLVELLTQASSHPDQTVAHALATCAGYAYSSEQTVAMIMARMGLEDNRCLRIEESVDAMFICATAFLIQSRCGRVLIVCFRGTEPSNFINWLTDLDLNPTQVPFHFRGASESFAMHGGFYRNVRAIRYEVVRAVERALRGRSVLESGGPVEHSLETLYVTGHSLGAAMAAIMGLMLSTEPAYAEIAAKLRAVYTFGQPMIGGPEIAAACDRDPFLGKNVVRYVYEHDVVPALPPHASGPFSHFGREYRFRGMRDPAWKPSDSNTKQVPHLLQVAGAPVAFLARQIRPLRNIPFQYSLDDHGPQHYIGALTPPGVQSEFGD